MLVPIVSAAWVGLCAGYNLLEPRIPNWILGVGFAGAVLFRNLDWWAGGMNGYQVIWILIIWGMALAFWFLGWWGGGDAKFLMIVSLAFPDVGMTLWMMAANFALPVVILVKKYGWKASDWLSEVIKPQRLAESGDRLRAVTIMGLGWFIWFVIELF